MSLVKELLDFFDSLPGKTTNKKYFDRAKKFLRRKLMKLSLIGNHFFILIEILL